MRTLFLYCAVLWSLFLPVHGWENVRLLRCLQNRTVNLFTMSYDNCAQYDNYDVEASRYPGVNFPLSVEALECLQGHDAFRSCASCYLCHYYLHHNQDIFAYKYALRSLEMSPQSVPALSCLAALYLKQGSHVRAAFYSSLAIHYNSSLQIRYHFLDRESIHNHMKHYHKEILYPDYSDLIAFLSYSEGKDNNARILKSHGIFLRLLKSLDGTGTDTLLSAYLDHLNILPRRMVGPSVLAYEEFLSHFESLLRWYAEVFLRFTGEPLAGGTGVLEGGEEVSELELELELDRAPDVLPALQWPADKTVVILVQPKYVLHSMTFDENVHGMCDTLARLGVPFRTVTRLLPDDAFVSLLNYGVEIHEVKAKNYIVWNFEKNIRLAKEFETPGMSFDECGNDHAVVDVDYAKGSVMVWETVPFNLFLWEESVASKMQLVTTPLPDEIILRTRAEQLFMDKIVSKLPTSVFYSQMDANRRIDILFFGNTNEHREALFSEFSELAKKNNLRVEFMMNYDLFGSHRDNLIDQAKVVLNLANRAWPRNMSHTAAAAEDTCHCAAAINLHRIRTLLARGKAVLSESTGSDIEEEMHKGLVAFAPTSQLTAVALELLRAPEARWRLERNARRFMTADHFSTSVPLFSDVSDSESTGRAGTASRMSSLALVAKALQTTAGDVMLRDGYHDILWPDRVHSRPPSPSQGGELELKMENRTFLKLREERVERRYEHSLDELSSLSRQKVSGSSVSRSGYEAVVAAARAAYAFAWAEMRCQGSGNQLNDLLYHNPVSTNMYGSIGGRNGSNSCDQIVDLEVLSGYLVRRYQYKGKILLIGCDETLAQKIRNAFVPQFQEEVEEEQENINLNVTCMSPEQFQMNDTPVAESSPSFDLIVINQALLRTSFSALNRLFTRALGWLSTEEGSSGSGSLLVNGMLPPFENHRNDGDWVNGDAYLLLIHMRNLQDFDAALGNFEGGLLVVHPRRNPYRVPQKDLDALKFSYSDFRKHIDKLIPILSFAEMHDWLSNAMYTTRFVRSLQP